MDSLQQFVRFQIDKITADRQIPIDLAAICQELGVVVEEREMVPEAVMQPRNGQFHIYLQLNFKSMPGLSQRRRFSWAHEIGHTLFYERVGHELRPRKEAPRGDALESACHLAAAMILVPNKALRAELGGTRVDEARKIVLLAEIFQVSVEVMVRRLHSLDFFADGWAPVLTRRDGDELTIEFASYPVWLKPYCATPKRGMNFTSWFRPTTAASRWMAKQFGEVTIEALPVEVSKSMVIFELHLRS